MKKIFIYLFALLFFSLCSTNHAKAQVVDDLNDIAVWAFNEGIYEDWLVDAAAYVNPQYCKRAWFKYSAIEYDIFPDPTLNLWTIPPLLNNYGALFEGGVQVAQMMPDKGWPCDNEYDDDHLPPFRIPIPVFFDFVTKNPDNNIYWEPSRPDMQDSICNVSIANENFRDFVLYWAYEQIDANVNALEFDQINGGYLFSYNADPDNNQNTGYDDYAIGTANFANRLSLVCGHGMNDPIQWFMPQASASSEVDSAKYAFDEDSSTSWISEIGSNHWIEIDFGRIRTVQQIYLQLHPEHIIQNFSIKYWDNEWVDFTPAINITGNTDLTKSFLIDSVITTKIRLYSTDALVYLPELQIFGQGFRQFLIKKYCVDSGWTATDSRWETEKLVNFADYNQCPDGTINSFNHRNYLQYHNWTLNPAGSTSFPYANPFFLEWFPHTYAELLMIYNLDDTLMVNIIEGLYSQSYSYQRLFLTFWKSVCDSVRNYAQEQNKEIYITCNGSVLFPHYVDYIMRQMIDVGIFPAYPAPSPTDSIKIQLDGSQAQINVWRLHKQRSIDYLSYEVPFVSFCDFWQLGMPFAHLGGIDEPADQRAIYLKTYAMEMYAAGINFYFPVIENEEIAWWDSTANGTALIDIIKQQTNFLNEYNEIYRDVNINSDEGEVTINEIVPFNGEWNWVGNRIICPVNDSKVTIAYMNKDNGIQSYLHIINHNWDSINHVMLPQYNFLVSIPVTDSCENLIIISPDFADTLYPSYTFNGDTINLTIDTLKYYNVIILELTDTISSINENQILPEINISVYPNPFKNQTTIYYELPEKCNVNFEIYNDIGQKIKTLVNRNQPAGKYSIVWNGTDDSEKQVSSGIYFYLSNINNKLISTKKIILMK